MLELDRYVVDKPVLSFRGRYVIKNEDERELGVALKKTVTTKTHVLMDDAKNELGHIRPQEGFRRSFMIFDDRAQLVGILKQKLLKILGKEFWFEDAFGDEKWRLIRDFASSDYILYDNEKIIKAKMSKVKKTFGHKYLVRIDSPSMDRLVILAAIVCADIAENSSNS